MRGVRLLGDRLGSSDCTGNLPFKKNQTKTKQVQTRIFATLSLNKKECVTNWCGLKSKKVTALRILVGLARAVRKQIGIRRLGGCNRRPLEKITAFKFCLFGAAPSRESSFFKVQVRPLYCDRLKVQYTHVFHRNILILLFLVSNQQFVLDWVVNTLSFKLTDIIILC